MTKERVLEAIQAHDSDGNGLKRVLKAADQKKLCPLSAKSCILAHAWEATVGPSSFETPNSSGKHDYVDVVDWFDAFPSAKNAAEGVKELLND